MRSTSVTPSPRSRSRAIDLGTKTCMSFMNSQGGKLGVSRFTGDRTLFLFVLARDFGHSFYPHVVDAQKWFLRDAFAKDEWEMPQILAALDSCTEFYFDRVSQIRMDAWSSGRVGLIGDAAFCVSLLAGQGSALAMTAAYVLAEELDIAKWRLPGGFPPL